MHLAQNPNGAALDVGCGNGRHIAGLFLAGFTNLAGLDIDSENIKAAKAQLAEVKKWNPKHNSKAKIELQTGDGTKLPFPKGKFHNVICSEVLEHVPDYYKMISELVRVLHPKGVLGVSVPRQFPETLCWWLSHEYQNEEGGHIRIFRAQELVADIEAHGLRLIRKHYAHGGHSPYWWLKCALGTNSARNWIVRLYHAILVWGMLRPKNWLVRGACAVLDPLMGKSVVLYFEKT